MKPSNPNFWTRVDGRLALRNLEREEHAFRHNIFQSWQRGEIDEPILIYYEVYDLHQSPANNLNNSLYERGACWIKTDDVVLDLGANIGIFSRFASDRGARKVYSFEPIQENFELLMLNRPNNCEAHRIAVSNKDNQSISMAYDKNTPGGSSFVAKSGPEQTVMTMTINTLVENGVIESPDFIKMDIEGAEVVAFEGIRDTILRNTRCIAMEMHANVLPEADVQGIYDRLISLGFKSYTLTNPDKCNIVWFTNTNPELWQE